MTIEVSRDRDSSFDPVIVPKHFRRLSEFDEQVPSLCAKGFTTGDIVDHVADIYGSKVSTDLVSKVTDAVLDELTEWQSRPLDPVWPVLFGTPDTFQPARSQAGDRHLNFHDNRDHLNSSGVHVEAREARVERG